MDLELINILVECYEPTTRTIKKLDGIPILVITRSYIEQCFRLSTQALTKIDKAQFKVDYEKTMAFKLTMITHFMNRGQNNRLMPIENMGPHPIDRFMNLFKNTFYWWA